MSVPYHRGGGLIPNIPDDENAPRTTGGCSAHRISLPYRKRLFFTPNASENASRTPGSLFEHSTHIPYHRRPSPVPNATKPKRRRALPATSITKPKMRRHCLQQVPQTAERRKALPASNATTARKEEASAKSAARLAGENKKRTTVKIVLFPIWGAMWGSNPRHPEPQSGALPTELIAPCQFGVTKVQRFFGIAREYSKKELSLCDWNKNRIREYVKRD